MTTASLIESATIVVSYYDHDEIEWFIGPKREEMPDLLVVDVEYGVEEPEDHECLDKDERIVRVTWGPRDAVLKLWAEQGGASFTPAAEAA